jgi:hypothetical protein
MAKRSRKPNEPARKGTRFQVNILLTAEAKDHIVAAAQASGRTTSREAEYLIETAITYNRVMKAMGTTIAQIEKGNVEAALHRLGYTAIRHSTGKKAWAEPGYPGVEHSGFVETAEQATPAQAPSPPVASPALISREEGARLLQEIEDLKAKVAAAMAPTKAEDAA